MAISHANRDKTNQTIKIYNVEDDLKDKIGNYTKKCN